MRKLLGTIFLLVMTCLVHSQYVSKIINPYHEAYHDSLKKMNYGYTFPILGKGAYKKGYDVPFPWGVSAGYFAARQEVLITKVAIAFNNSESVDLSPYITFGTIQNKVGSFTFRPDLWVLPFLNIYGIFSRGKTQTTVPLVRPVYFSTIQNFNASSAGFGFTLAGGVGHLFLVLDNNFNWASTDALVEPVPAYNLDARIGHNFVDPLRADRGLAIWFGAFYQKIEANTVGSIKLSDLLPNGSAGMEDKFIEHLQEWADGLPPAQKKVADQLITKIDAYFDGREPGDATITYNLDKKLAGPWNLIFGAQYQHNKHWQLRTEIGTFGKRTSFIAMLSYRFQGIRKK